MATIGQRITDLIGSDYETIPANSKSDLMLAAVNEVVRIIRSDQESIPISTFENADIDVIEFSINKSSKFIKNSYKISDIPENISLLAIYRSNKIIIPKNDDLIQASDEILVLTKQEYIKETEELFI